MLINIRSTRSALSSRLRRIVEFVVRRAFQRERVQLSGSTVRVQHTKLRNGQAGFLCTVGLWSSKLGRITVRHTAVTIRTAVQQACIRARETVRRRMHKRLSRSRRTARNGERFRPIHVCSKLSTSS